MKRFIFILGGARSGKSGYAVELAKRLGKRIVFIATAEASDQEMRKKIRLHKMSRPKCWALIEETKDIACRLRKLESKYDAAVIDCLGLWISNLLMDNLTDSRINKKIEELMGAISKTKVSTIVVSNEVGSGIVPIEPLARRFRDLVGRANQLIAKEADEVILMAAGLPAVLKSKRKV